MGIRLLGCSSMHRASLEEEVAKLREQTGESAREGKERFRTKISAQQGGAKDDR